MSVPAEDRSARRIRLRLGGLRPSTSGVDRRTLGALALLLSLVQLPHVMHLPAWVSAAGLVLIGSRLLAARRPDLVMLDRMLSSIALTLLSVVLALCIRWHYGYFIGRDPAVAFLFLLVAAKFAELRRGSDASTLLCLSSFLLLTLYFYSQTLIAALVTLPAVLALGHALAVLRDPAGAPALHENLRLVGTMLLQGAPLAVLLFVLFPRLPGPLWSLPEDGTATTGLSDSMSPGSIGSLSMSDAVAFRVEFDDKVPPRAARYWRGPVLDRFDGSRWSMSRSRREMESEERPVDPGADTLAYSVLLEPHLRRGLFALERPAGLPRGSNAAGADGRALARLMHDGQLIADDAVTRVLGYRQRSTLSGRWPTQRPPDASLSALPGRNPRTARLARQLRTAHPDPFDFAQAVLSRFSSAPFAYTLTPPLLGDAPTDEFLFDTRAGFCEHYASAFTVLMRAAGIPARVVTGYLGGQMNGDYMIVRQSDAHAWAEAWIEGAWHRFDPTGAIAPSRVETGPAAALSGDALLPRLSRGEASWLTGLALRWDRVNHGWQRLVVDFDDDSQAELWERLGLDTPLLWQSMLAVIVAGAAWSGLLLGWRPCWPDRWRRRPTPVVERAWQRLEHRLDKDGLPRRTGETGSVWLSRAAQARPDQAERLRALARRFERLRFAATRPSGEGDRLAAEVRELIRAMPRR